MAVNKLHFHIMEKLQGIKELLAYESDDKLSMAEELADAVVSSVICTIDSLVIGVWKTLSSKWLVFAMWVICDS